MLIKTNEKFKQLIQGFFCKLFTDESAVYTTLHLDTSIIWDLAGSRNMGKTNHYLKIFKGRGMYLYLEITPIFSTG